MKRIFTFILVLTTLVLELLPFGAVCNFMTPPGEPPLRLTYPYFSLTPFGYANFAPFIVAILTCVLAVLVIISLLAKRKLRMPVLCVAALSTLLSLCPLLLGISYYSVVGLLITLCLLCVTVLNFFDRSKA